MRLFFMIAIITFGNLIFAQDTSKAANKKYVDLNGYHLEAEVEEWFLCEKDEDCINFTYPCSGGTVNVSFVKQAQLLYSNQNAARDCAVREPKKNDPPFKVFCKIKRCGSQGRNSKIGFS